MHDMNIKHNGDEDRNIYI